MAITNDGVTCQTYVNGKLEGSGVVTGTLATDSNIIYVGSSLDGSPTNYLKGTIDEIRISDIARTADEIQYNAKRHPYSLYTSKKLNAIMTIWFRFDLNVYKVWLFVYIGLTNVYKLTIPNKTLIVGGVYKEITLDKSVKSTACSITSKPMPRGK